MTLVDDINEANDPTEWWPEAAAAVTAATAALNDEADAADGNALKMEWWASITGDAGAKVIGGTFELTMQLDETVDSRDEDVLDEVKVVTVVPDDEVVDDGDDEEVTEVAEVWQLLRGSRMRDVHAL